jgi:hypothetical protein
MKSGGEKITLGAFYQQIAQVGGPDLVAFARWVVENAPAHGLTVRWGDAGPLVSFIHKGHPSLPGRESGSRRGRGAGRAVSRT